MNPFPSENAAPASGKPHLVWIDCARWIAMFLVVVCHACDPFNCSPDALTNPEFLRWGAIWGSLLRPSVPLFVMITGALLLPVRETTLGAFYKKRIPRVLFPFLIWSALYALFPWFASLATATPEDAKALTTAFFPYSGFMNGGNGPETTLSSALATLATTPFSFNYFSVHLWYVYMLIGLYLYLPIFSAWVEKVSLKTKAAFLGIWGATLLLPYADVFLTPHLPFGNGYLLGTCSWNAFGTLYAFAGFNGYLLLGHVLARISRELSVKKTLAVALPTLFAGTLLTFVGFFWVRLTGSLDKPEVFAALADGAVSGKIAALAQAFAGTDPAQISAAAKMFQAEPMVELFWTYCSLNVALSSAALFLLISKIDLAPGRLARFLATLGKLGFGVYLVHYLFVGPSYLLAVKIGVPLPLQIPVSALFAFAATYVLVRALYAVLPKPKIFLG